MRRREDGDGPATVDRHGPRAAPGRAAFANAMAANALDYDDTGATGHPGATVIPAALPSRRRGAGPARSSWRPSWPATRCGSGSAREPSRAGQRRVEVYGSGTTQTFGAVVAAGRLLGLGADEMLPAFGLAGAFAPLPHEAKFGWDEGQLSWVKDNVAWPTEAGVRAAQLATRGFPATQTILDGRARARPHDGIGPLRPRPHGRELGTTWDILTLSLKPYPCCRWIHSTLDVLREVIRDHGVATPDVRRVTVRSIEALATWFDGRRPPTMVDAAVQRPPRGRDGDASSGRVRSGGRRANRDDPAVLALMDQVALEAEPAAQEACDATGAPLSSSSRHRDRRDREAATRGHPAPRAGGIDEPLGDDEVEQKYRELAEPVLGASGAARVRELVDALETLDTLTPLTAALAPKGVSP